MQTTTGIIAIFILLGILFVLLSIPYEKSVECSLSLCDCKCYPKGQTPEEKTGVLCGINCLGEYGVKGCEYKNGQCTPVYVQTCEDDEDCSPLGENYKCRNGICQEETGLPNPASVHCIQNGGTLYIKTKPEGQYGICVFPDGSECEEWEFYRGECMSCTEYCESQPHIACVGYWIISGNYPDCSCEYVCSSTCEKDLDCPQPRCLGMKAVCENSVCKIVTTEGKLTKCGETSDKYSCQDDSDCVPATCCHSDSCVNKDYQPNCKGIMCTLECQSGTMDCGQGHCSCIDGQCQVIWSSK